MIVYYEILDDGECDKISQVFGYKDLNDYLLKNDYCNKKGEPDINVLREKTYVKDTKEYKG